jgi:predicted ribonuclease YlaK
VASKKIPSVEKKIYVLDTNVLMNYPDAPYVLSGAGLPDEDAQDALLRRYRAAMGREYDNSPNTVIIPGYVLDELDGIKANPRQDSDVKHLARRAATALEELIEYAGSEFTKVLDVHPYFKTKDSPAVHDPYGVSANRSATASSLFYETQTRQLQLTMYNGGKVLILDFPFEFRDATKVDDKIISVAEYIANTKINSSVVFVTQDRIAKLSAIARGVAAEELLLKDVYDPNDSFKTVRLFNPQFLEKSTPLLAPLLDRKPFTLPVDDLRSDALKRVVPDLYPNMFFGLSEDETRPEDIFWYHVSQAATSDTYAFSPIDPLKISNLISAHNKKVSMRSPDGLTKDNSASEYTGKSNTEVKQDLQNKMSGARGSPKNKSRVSKLLKGITERTTRPKLENIIHQVGQLVTQSSQTQNEPSKRGDVARANEPEEVFTGIHLPLNEIYIPRFNQVPYVDSLLNPDIRVISVSGPPGTAKTYHALLAGLIMIEGKKYDQVLYSRSIIQAGDEIGFVPGTKEEKLRDWMESARGNLKAAMGEKGYDRTRSPAFKRRIESELDYLERCGVIEYDIVNQLRGQNVHNTWWIFDEFQSLRPDQARLILGRVGENTKLIAIGDFDQIDNPSRGVRLGSENSGLAKLINGIQDEPWYAHINIGGEAVVRSVIAQAANKIR